MLEAALATSWDRDTLAVYADHLQAHGDPRGELIALDLQIEQRGATPERIARRTALLHEWLGALVPLDSAQRPWVGDSLRYGFIEDLQVDSDDPMAHERLAVILQSTAAPYLKGVSLRGNGEDIDRALAALARRPHAWLARLTISTWDWGPAASAATIAALIAVTPNLTVLEIHGYPAFASFAHPAVRRLRVTGPHLHALVAGSAASFATVRELDLAFADDTSLPSFNLARIVEEDFAVEAPEEPPIAVDALRDLALPALQRLDLSRNEPDVQAPSTAFRFLRRLSVRAQLTHLVLPSIRSEDDVRDLVAAVADMPALVEVVIARGHYHHAPDLPHPARFVRAPAWPWPRPDAITAPTLTLVLPGARDAEIVRLVDAARVMERRFAALPVEAREAWSELWTRVAQLDATPEQSISPIALGRAVDAVPNLLDGGWRELRENLAARRPFAPDAAVTLRRTR